MTPFLFALRFLAATCLLVVRFRSRRSRDVLEISSRYRAFFRQLGVTETSCFLALSGARPHIVSGHPDRNVARITFAGGDQRWNAFLKREHHVSWWTRLSNAVAGFGWVSRSLREARTLQTLEREGLPGPEWMAAGEDEYGRAFLLVRETPGSELRAVLEAEKEPRRRKRLARQLGALLARLHAAGFRHPDLYANHVFVDCARDSIHLLDWQRAYLRRAVSWRTRRRDLAALHATLDEALATPEERLICLRTYWRLSGSQIISWPAAVEGVEAEARRLLNRRHIREKRRPPAAQQAWICLAGESLCVTPDLQARCGERLMDYLSVPGKAGAAGTSRRWLALPDAARGLLVQGTSQRSLTSKRQRQGRTGASTEQRQAALLLRLQRHGIAAPQVLALGQSHEKNGQGESFLLTDPLPDTCSLEAWLVYRTRRRAKAEELAQRWSVLRQAGEFLRQLHEASCYLDFALSGCGLSVRRTEVGWNVIIDNADSLTPHRRQKPRRALRDLRRMQQMLRWAGCSRSDLCRFRAGYGGKEIDSRSHAPPGNARPAAPRPVPARDGTSIVPTCIPTRSVGTREALWRRVLWGVRRLYQRPDWPRFAGADWADRIMGVAITDRFIAKQGRSTGRWIVTDPAETGEQPRRLSVFLKRHYELPWWRGWLAMLWPWRNWSPAWQELNNLEWARRQGLAVPRTVAAAEYLGPWGKLRSFLAVEELAGMVSLQQAIPLAGVRQDALSFRRWKRSLAVELARLTRLLHDRRCFHKDLYLCHFFIANEDTHSVPAEGWRGRLHLIDLHRLAHHPLTWRIWQTKDLAELLYSSDIIGVNVRDRLAFWRAYRGGGLRRHRSPWIRWAVLYRWRRYRRHNHREEGALPREQTWT